LGRDLVEGEDLAAELTEAGQLDLARAVVDHRGLLEGQVGGVERGGGVGQVAAVEGVGADRADEPDAAEHEEAGEEEQRDGERRAAGGATSTSTPGGSVAAVPLTPLEGGLHDGGDDTIGSVRALSPHRVALSTTLGTLL